MKTVTIPALAKAIGRMPAVFKVAIRGPLKTFGVHVAAEAKKKFGTYQPRIGAFPHWPPLAVYTIIRKFGLQRKKRGSGYKKAGVNRHNARGDMPLIGVYPGSRSPRIGRVHLKDDIHVKTRTLPHEIAVFIGTDNYRGVVHEYGSVNRGLGGRMGPIPPRPFLRNTAFEQEENFLNTMIVAFETAFRLLP